MGWGKTWELVLRSQLIYAKYYQTYARGGKAKLTHHNCLLSSLSRISPCSSLADWSAYEFFYQLFRTPSVLAVSSVD